VNCSGPEKLGLAAGVSGEGAAYIAKRAAAACPRDCAIEKWHEAAIHRNHIWGRCGSGSITQRDGFGERRTERLFHHAGNAHAEQLDSQLTDPLRRHNSNNPIELFAVQHFVDVTVGRQEAILGAESLRPFEPHIARRHQLNLPRICRFVPGKRDGVTALRVLSATN